MSYWNVEQTRISRKERDCVWCGETILKGDKYIFQSGIMEGEWQNNHYHPECFECLDYQCEFIPHENDRPKAATEFEKGGE